MGTEWHISVAALTLLTVTHQNLEQKLYPQEKKAKWLAHGIINFISHVST